MAVTPDNSVDTSPFPTHPGSRHSLPRTRLDRLSHAVTSAALIALVAITLSAPLHTEAQELDSSANSAPTTASPVPPRPTTPTYRIQGFQTTGDSPLSPSELNSILKNAIGEDISLKHIQTALRQLQYHLQSNGHPRASIRLPRQSMTSGIVQIDVQGLSDAETLQPHTIESRIPDQSSSPSTHTDPSHPTQTALPRWHSAPAYDIRHFVIRGNTILGAEELDRILSPAAGPSTDLDRLGNTLRELRAAYKERGFTNVTITAPSQVLTDGTLALVVREGEAPFTEATQPGSEPEQPPSPKFEVRGYRVTGNTLLSQEWIDDILNVATGPEVDLAQIQKALGELQLAYGERGLATVAVALPQQQLADGIVEVQVVEGALVDIQISGNQHFSSNNIVRALPSLRTNTVLNSLVFQRELDLANQNRDRQIYPVLGPGPDPGTSALTLRVEDRFPLHGRIEINNHATPGTPEWRINTSAQYNNLWQREHQLGVSYGFTPEAFKGDVPGMDYLVNRPLIAYAGAYYRLPLGQPESVEQQIQTLTGFGFDEATRQFRPPPANARPDITFYLSVASTDTGIQLGPENVVSQTPLLTIISQDSGQNISLNDTYGVRFNRPISLSEPNRLQFSAGIDYKRFLQESFNTNNFIITTVVTNAQGSQTIESRVASPQPARSGEILYLPLTLGADFTHIGSNGISSASFSLAGNLLGDDADFASVSYSPDARARFGKANLQLVHDHKVFKTWSLLLRASGQAATGPLPSNEQFAIGGMANVRGYFEGEDVGDSGWSTGGELRTPFIPGRVPIPSGTVPAWIRGSVFMEYAQRFHLDTDATSRAERSLWSVGFGVSANINNHLDLKVTVGWPLLDSINRSAFDPRANLSVGGQF